MTHPCPNWDFSKLPLLPLWVMAGTHLSPQAEDPFPKKSGASAFSRTMPSLSKVLSRHNNAQCHSIHTHQLILDRSKNGNSTHPFGDVTIRERGDGNDCARKSSCLIRAPGDVCEIVFARACMCVCEEWRSEVTEDLSHTANRNSPCISFKKRSLSTLTFARYTVSTVFQRDWALFRDWFLNIMQPDAQRDPSRKRCARQPSIISTFAFLNCWSLSNIRFKTLATQSVEETAFSLVACQKYFKHPGWYASPSQGTFHTRWHIFRRWKETREPGRNPWKHESRTSSKQYLKLRIEPGAVLYHNKEWIFSMWFPRFQNSAWAPQYPSYFGALWVAAVTDEFIPAIPVTTQHWV